MGLSYSTPTSVNDAASVVKTTAAAASPAISSAADLEKTFRVFSQIFIDTCVMNPRETLFSDEKMVVSLVETLVLLAEKKPAFDAEGKLLVRCMCHILSWGLKKEDVTSETRAKIIHGLEKFFLAMNDVQADILAELKILCASPAILLTVDDLALGTSEALRVQIEELSRNAASPICTNASDFDRVFGRANLSTDRSRNVDRVKEMFSGIGKHEAVNPPPSQQMLQNLFHDEIAKYSAFHYYTATEIADFMKTFSFSDDLLAKKIQLIPFVNVDDKRIVVMKMATAPAATSSSKTKSQIYSHEAQWAYFSVATHAFISDETTVPPRLTDEEKQAMREFFRYKIDPVSNRVFLDMLKAENEAAKKISTFKIAVVEIEAPTRSEKASTRMKECVFPASNPPLADADGFATKK
jgi:hypothetical protein